MITYGKLISVTFLVIGIFILMQIILPVLSFKLWEVGASLAENVTLISPKPNGGRNILGVSIQSNDNSSLFISKNKRDKLPYSHFSITVPKLKIDNINVLVEENDLEKGLIHLPGTSLPGERGNIFISGHSAATPAVSFKNIHFAYLTDLKKGDEIILSGNGSKFKYNVVSIKVVDPKDVSVIEPPDLQGRYVTLMTCVPPGLNFKRLVVLGKMI